MSEEQGVSRAVSGYPAIIDMIVDIVESDYGLKYERTSPESAIIYYSSKAAYERISDEISIRISRIVTGWSVEQLEKQRNDHIS